MIFIADSLDNAYKFRQVLSSMDVDVSAGSSLQFKKLLSQKKDCDLVIYETRNDATTEIAAAEQLLVEAGGPALLVILDDEMLSDFRLPMQVKADFVVLGASQGECSARIRQLL